MNKVLEINKLYKNSFFVLLERMNLINLKRVELKNGLKFNLLTKGSRPCVSETFGKKRYTLFKNIKKGDVVIDIGAYIGDFTILAGSNGAKVYAFEPIKESIDILEKNVNLNNLKDIKTFNMVVSNTTGLKKIKVHDLKEVSSLINSDKINQQSEIIDIREVPSTTLEEILNLTGNCDFLKIDTEGNEAEIIMSTPKEVLQKIKYIAMESTDYQETFTKNIKLLNYLIECGFELKVLTHNNDLNCIKIYGERKL